MPESPPLPKTQPLDEKRLVVPQFTPPTDATIVVLTGAGISKESGLDTFRDADGIWSKVRWEDVATPQAFARDPERVHAFYNTRRARVGARNIQPNAAHAALARLEVAWNGVYGKALCNFCGHAVDWVGGLRPDVVWFGEVPRHLDEIREALACCDMFISIGTSGNVYPAAGFVAMARQLQRAHTVELNLEPSLGASHFHEFHHGPATVTVPTYVEGLLDGL